jgi:glycosyltransferase involved in cell wall biosynthesis
VTGVKIALVANYEPDAQQSMLRYAAMLEETLVAAGHEVRSTRPAPRFLPPRARRGSFAHKWLGNLDKYLVGPAKLDALRAWADVVHVCDHSSAVWLAPDTPTPQVITCHDLLAVRGALGEPTDCAASPTGALLQRWILRNLRRAAAIACVSEATRRDVQRLLPDYEGIVDVIANPFPYAYRERGADHVRTLLSRLPGIQHDTPYVLVVGSGLPRKNRELLPNLLAALGTAWQGQLVFAGEPASAALRQQASTLGVVHRMVDVPQPDNVELEALYNGARALLFPSRHEGFGWPPLEAQSCGCPVIASNRPPMTEVCGQAALYCDPTDAHAWAEALLRLEASETLRAGMRAQGLINASRYSPSRLLADCEALYSKVMQR